jgi:hypothetical protein
MSLGGAPSGPFRHHATGAYLPTAEGYSPGKETLGHPRGHHKTLGIFNIRIECIETYTAL